MFGMRIGGSGKLYLLVYLRAVGEERWAFWKPVTPAQYRLEGRGGDGCILLNDPTLPHPLTGRALDPPLHRHRDALAAWREMQELRASTRDLLLASDAELEERRERARRKALAP